MNATAYIGSEQWDRDVDNAAEHWIVLHDDRGGRTPAGRERWQVRYVEAEANTGSRYAVVVSEMPTAREGAPVLVTVLAPWETAYCLQWDGDLHIDYVYEKFGSPARRANNVPCHGGDIAALTLTIAYALDREAVLR